MSARSPVQADSAVAQRRSGPQLATDREPDGATQPVADPSRADQGESARLLWDAQRLTSVHAQADKAARVRRMFDAIAPTYELVNTLCSAGRDRSWRRRAVRLAGLRPGEAVLDVACGTGDFLRAFARWGAAPAQLVGTDFSAEMLHRAPGQGPAPAAWCRADALRLPFADASFDVVSCAFGVRNFQDLDRGLREMWRVLRPRGRAVILEFTRPANALTRALYEFYAARIMPAVAALISRDPTGAYRYLPHSVVSFPAPEQLRGALRTAGFTSAEATPLTCGIVAVYVATKGQA